MLLRFIRSGSGTGASDELDWRRCRQGTGDRTPRRSMTALGFGGVLFGPAATDRGKDGAGKRSYRSGVFVGSAAYATVLKSSSLFSLVIEASVAIVVAADVGHILDAKEESAKPQEGVENPVQGGFRENAGWSVLETQSNELSTSELSSSTNGDQFLYRTGVG